jgi:hypothetical protein
VLRGDHRCPYINGWVGIGNHRIFFLAVLYAAAFAAYSSYWMIRVLLAGAAKGWDLVFCIGLLVPTIWVGTMNAGQVWHQARNISQNATTIEVLYGVWQERKNPYDRGCARNWEDVCGSWAWCWLWWLPIKFPMVEDGFGYPKDEQAEENKSFLRPEWGE